MRPTTGAASRNPVKEDALTCLAREAAASEYHKRNEFTAEIERRDLTPSTSSINN
jgi:hypothetical protein